MKEQILEIMAEVLEINTQDFPDTINQEYLDNWDSLRHLNLVVELEEAFGVSYEPEEIAVMTSIEKIVEITKIKINEK
jgi:acyl carrier protein